VTYELNFNDTDHRLPMSMSFN